MKFVFFVSEKSVEALDANIELKVYIALSMLGNLKF